MPGGERHIYIVIRLRDGVLLGVGGLVEDALPLLVWVGMGAGTLGSDQHS